MCFNEFFVVQALKPLIIIEDVFLKSEGFKDEVIAKLGRELAANQVKLFKLHNKFQKTLLYRRLCIFS